MYGTIYLQISVKQYREPKLVLFSGSVQSACGVAGSSTGPFYCPGDQKLYIDLSFYQELQSKFKAPGDFAMAYVVAHEVGHHIQNLLGTMEKVQQLRSRVSQEEYNQYSIRLEFRQIFMPESGRIIQIELKDFLKKVILKKH
jgi:uncharacterized protein